ncbi:CYTH domain-containing protein [Bacillus salitolerans]|uniref:CYTH domain-containing protein n=1 Tax=Bacillus salitolerans TaxID=1437434 RepID=A0ABW4LK71_9BACI
MNQEIEIEFKNVVTKGEFEQLLIAFSISEEMFVSQVNYYFDTTKFSLKNKGSALRIRYKKGTYTLTLKEPLREGLLETHQDISKTEAEMMLQNGPFIQGDIYKRIEVLGIDPKEVIYLGSLRTNRAETMFKQGTLVFDHSFYLGKEDYELEFEASDYSKGQHDFKELLSVHHIPVRKTDNKIKRFFNEKNRQQTID